MLQCVRGKVVLLCANENLGVIHTKDLQIKFCTISFVCILNGHQYDIFFLVAGKVALFVIHNDNHIRTTRRLQIRSRTPTITHELLLSMIDFQRGKDEYREPRGKTNQGE